VSTRPGGLGSSGCPLQVGTASASGAPNKRAGARPAQVGDFHEGRQISVPSTERTCHATVKKKERAPAYLRSSFNARPSPRQEDPQIAPNVVSGALMPACRWLADQEKPAALG
jgi:hypothetical protein